MRNVRAVLVPIGLLLALGALAWLVIDVPIIAHFDFIWDVLLGALLGAGLAVLPAWAGYPPKRNAQTGMFWACGFVALLLIFYQYMTQVTGLGIEALAFLSTPGTRMRIVEGAFMGYCSLIAGRGKM